MKHGGRRSKVRSGEGLGRVRKRRMSEVTVDEREEREDARRRRSQPGHDSGASWGVWEAVSVLADSRRRPRYL